MTTEQIKWIVSNGRFPGSPAPVEWTETHISWVILTPDYAFKIKKPLQLPFLDFSTVEKRKFYCREELRLNQRLAADMYLDVLPVYLDKYGPEISAEQRHEQPLDYALRMKRMDNRRQMDVLLRQQAVSEKDLATLARMLVLFHRAHVLPRSSISYQPGSNRADFDDLFGLTDVAVAIFGAAAEQTMLDWQRQVALFLEKHEERFHERAHSGFWIDGHGDLHGRNIFLLPEGPVVFDCIEFNAHFRQLDVLNELAFLCMDLDAAGQPELAGFFLHCYGQHWRCMEKPEDQLLFQYFKAYRANVRLKVALLELQQHRSDKLETSAGTYWELLGKYLANLGM